MQKKCAFTIVELLVVIAIIGILCTLLLPAVQAARESARRGQCSANLRQIGLAIHNFHNANNKLPAGNVIKEAGVCPGNNPDIRTEDGANWLIMLLPYVEQQSLYESYDFASYNEGLPNRRVCESFVNVYVCPADADNDKLSVPGGGPAAAGSLNLPYMPGSYRAVSGRSDGYRYLDSGEFATYPQAWRGAIHAVGAKGFQAERFTDVRDGTSNTLMAGESTTKTSRAWRTFWAYSYAHFSLSAATPQERTLWGNYEACVAAGGAGKEKPCKRGWGGYHPQGMNFLLCDGAVRFLPTSIDMDLFANLATIEGGEIGHLPE